MRLSACSLAGTARTLVAVGTCSEASMFDTIFAATPLIGVVCAPVAAGAVAAGLVGCWRGRGAGRLGRRGGWVRRGGAERGRRRAAAASAAARGAPAPWRRRLAAAGAVAAGSAGRRRRAVRPVVGEEVVPGRVDAGRVGQVALVHVLDDPLVGAEAHQRVCPAR